MPTTCRRISPARASSTAARTASSNEALVVALTGGYHAAFLVGALLLWHRTHWKALAAADDVIDNGGERDALRNQVAALHQKYLQFGRP